MTAREFCNQMEKIIAGPGQGLIGDMQSGYVYVNKKQTPAKYGIDPLAIEKVVFNPPATIILWADKTKTVVKCQDGEPFDPEKGMAMAFMKKVRGNTGGYFKEIDKWCAPYFQKEFKEKLVDDFKFDIDIAREQLAKATEQITKAFGIPKEVIEKEKEINRKPTLKDLAETFVEEKEVMETTKSQESEWLKEVLRYECSSDVHE